MDKKSLADVEEYARCLADDAFSAKFPDNDRSKLIARAHQHFAQIALSMGYTIAPRKPLPSIATTAGDV